MCVVTVSTTCFVPGLYSRKQIGESVRGSRFYISRVSFVIIVMINPLRQVGGHASGYSFWSVRVKIVEQEFQ